MIRVTVSTREEVSAVIAALGAAGLRNLDDYTITGAPPDAPGGPQFTCSECGYPHMEHERGLLFCGRCGSTEVLNAIFTCPASGSGGSEEGGGS